MAQIRFRFSKFSLAVYLKLALLTGVFLLLQTPQALLAQAIPRRWQAKQYKPPSGIGAPTRTEGGGTRGSTANNRCPIVGKSLTALVPGDRFGVTVAPYPTFFVYMPAASAPASPLPVEFELQDKDGNRIYKSIFKTSGKPGILSLTLPSQAGLPPLTVGQDYKWLFSIICQPDERSGDITVDGWVRRVELNATLNNQLKQASPQQQVELYAGAEIWQDALATLVELRRKYPNDGAIAAAWQQLLSAADLNAIAQESLAASPTKPETRFTSSQP
ncbi:DUF928 domain-containing protein [Allocoleopsis sp.]|uniref:DUF928 domain-containing protein n=1 Tax=Allocoleopsis sp. TaxID=3088169 RepID=UPI002FD71C29